MGISQMEIGVSLIFAQFLKGKWQHICCAAALGMAVGATVFEELDDNRPHATEREVGV